ncbi:MAG: hypothetical protein WA807_14485 [Steroidobacteraceae bacterium]
MNDKFEIWSLPWHALQRRLAADVGAEASARKATYPRGAGAGVMAVPASSWLARALSNSALSSALPMHG